ncbi:MAG: tyrosine-type recombinase/integrase [Pseudobdellovibrionaceae bacterium]
MAKMKFDARTVASLRVENGRKDFFDQALQCFGIRITDAGRKTWFVAYRIAGRKRRYSLGTFPGVSLADARDRAKVLLGEIAAGCDPMQKREEARAAGTVEELVKMYLASAKLKKVSWKDDEHKLNTYLIPRFGKLKADQLRRSDVMSVLDHVSTKGFLVEPNRALRVIRRMYNWGLERELVTANPCFKIKNPVKEYARTRVLTPGELKTFWDTLESELSDNWAGTRKDKIKIVGIFKLMLTTGQRGGEVKAMEWNEIDLNDKMWTIPKEKMKARNHHRVPLNDMSLRILKELKLITGQSRFVFPSPCVTNAHIDNIQKAVRRFRSASSLMNFTPHDLRRSAASHMATMGVPRLVIKKILGHACADITSVYDLHTYDFEKSKALNIWSERLFAIVSGQTDFSTDKDRTAWLRVERF